jgi:hypothetical protein
MLPTIAAGPPPLPGISIAQRMASTRQDAYARLMRYPNEFVYGDPGPEEVALDSWLEDSGPYVTLAEGHMAADAVEDPEDD